MRGPALGLLLALACLSARAEDGDACRFDWPLQRERAWFEAAALPKVESGGTLPADAPGAMLALRPAAEAALPERPTREPKPGTFAGFLRVAAPTMPGLYQITLSDEGWLDVSQEGEGPRRPLAHTGRRTCPGLRKSLRFQLASKPVAITVSNATAATIKIAIAPAE